MIVLPWFIRFGLDCTIALGPIIYFHYHPTTFFLQYFQDRRRIIRRKSFEEFKFLDNESEMKVEEVRALYKQLGINPNC